MSMKLEQQQENESTPDVITLLTPLQLGALSLPNRIVMSPMTRARSTDGVPTDIEVKYYSQRASAGLIITAGIYISRMAVGGINVPGIYTDQQIDSWQRINEAVHSAWGENLRSTLPQRLCLPPFAVEWRHPGRSIGRKSSPEGDECQWLRGHGGTACLDDI
jgi:hypothetical protein